MRPAAGTVVAVSTSPKHGFSKQPRSSIRLLAGQGVEGDAHCGETVQHIYLKRRNPAAPNRMQVHLLASELLEELNARSFPVAPGNLGENILTAGLNLITMPLGTRLHLGADAVVELTCLRQPCKQIDEFQKGLQSQMYARPGCAPRYRAGVMAIVLQAGEVWPGDKVEVLLPPLPHRELAA